MSETNSYTGRRTDRQTDRQTDSTVQYSTVQHSTADIDTDTDATVGGSRPHGRGSIYRGEGGLEGPHHAVHTASIESG